MKDISTDEPRPLQILSLGAGVQSSTLALMSAVGELPMFDCAIFSDTQAEPKSVYDYLDWIESVLPFPVHRVSAGNLTAAVTTTRTSKTSGLKFSKVGIPFFTLNPDGSKGIAQRQCTRDYKIVPIRRKLRALARPRRMEKDTLVIQSIGISLDEIIRCKPSRDVWITHVFPLVKRRMTRRHCLEWMEAKGYPKPPRSACVFCPYHSNVEWRRLQTEEPEEFAKAVALEKVAQESRRSMQWKGTPYLHSSLKPLNEIDFRSDVEHGQQLLFQDECEGMCGN